MPSSLLLFTHFITLMSISLYSTIAYFLMGLNKIWSSIFFSSESSLDPPLLASLLGTNHSRPIWLGPLCPSTLASPQLTLHSLLPPLAPSPSFPSHSSLHFSLSIAHSKTFVIFFFCACVWVNNIVSLMNCSILFYAVE